MTDTTLTIDAASLDRIKRVLAATYWCAGQLDKDHIADDSGEPLRIIANELEKALGLNIDLAAAGVWRQAEQDATGGDLGLAHAIECYTMPSQIVRDAIEAADIKAALRTALNVEHA